MTETWFPINWDQWESEMKNQVELQQSFDFAGISDFVAGFLLTLGASRMLENPQLYGPVTVSWRNYHLSSGQYLPIMLQAWGRCSKISFLLKDSFLQECHSFLTQSLNSKILGQWQRSWLIDGVCASVRKSLTGLGACPLFISPSAATCRRGRWAQPRGAILGAGPGELQSPCEHVVTAFSASLIQKQSLNQPSRLRQRRGLKQPLYAKVHIS